MKICALAHAAYYVKDLDRSMDFYVNKLGFLKKFSLTWGDLTETLLMVIGSGIGGGIMIDRKIYAGEHFCSGELSLLRVSDSYQIDSAFLVSGGIGGLQRQVQRATGNNESLSGHEIFSRVNAGNPDACEALDRYCADFAIQIYNLQAILDLNVIAIGGGISAQPILIERLRKKVQDIYAYEAQFQAPPRIHIHRRERVR